MIQNIDVPIQRDRLWMDENVVYAQVPGWCDRVTDNLRMTVIYHDSGKKDVKLPCLLWICGGGWKWMDVQSYLPNLMDLVNRGYVLVSAEYQCSSFATFPAPLKQLKEAVRYIRAHAARYGIDPAEIGVIGESSGGHLASLIGTTGDRKEFQEGSCLDQSDQVQAVCSWYTPVALDTKMEVPELQDLVDRFLGTSAAGKAAAAESADPRTYIDTKTPPFLLLHGTADTLVPIECSELLYNALREKGVPVDYYRINGADHADYPFFQPKVMAIIGEFFDSCLKEKAGH